MQHIVTATSATVFIHSDFHGIDKDLMKNDYHQTFHSKRPADPVIHDKWFYLSLLDTDENTEVKQSIEALAGIHDLRAVNFLVLSEIENTIDSEVMKSVKKQLKEWESFFNRNSFNGNLNLRICTQNFQASLLEGYKIRGINRLVTWF